MKLSEADIKKMQDYFATQKDIVAVYLYGSFAKGTINKGSDIDFGVLFNGKIDSYSRLGEIYSGLPSLKGEPDVRDLDLNYSPIYLLNVIQGRLIYSKDEKKRINFEVEVMRRFYDTQHLRDISLDYMRKRLQEGTYGY